MPGSPTPFHRRSVLTAALAAGAAGAAAACSPDADDATGTTVVTGPAPSRRPPPLPDFRPDPRFPEGVLSGSPTPAAVVLWTRVAAPAPDADVPVTVEVATEPSFRDPVLTREAVARADDDHCVHVDADGLEPASWYFYRFVTEEGPSPVGRTRTAPQAGDRVDSAHVAFFSCQRYTHGWYTAHRHLAAQEDLDLVISLGDYVYDDSSADGIRIEERLDPTPPAVDRATYRGKYALYRSDPDLQAMHAAAPLVCVPDNHDGRDDAADAGTKTQGAIDTFFERMPVRRDPEDPERVHTDLAWGDLFHLWLLDLRRFKDERIGGFIDTANDRRALDPARSTLGEDQRRWLFDGLAGSTSTWKLVGSSQMFSPARLSDADDVATRAGEPDRTPNAGTYINGSQWDGFQAERTALLQHLHDRGVANTIVLSGDMHWFSAADLRLDADDPDSPYVLSEFLGSSITSAAGSRFSSDGGPVTPQILPIVRAANDGVMRYFDVDRHGYGSVRLAPGAADVDFVSPATVMSPDAPVEVLASFRLTDGGGPMEVTAGAQP